jgi:hypothetical protein
MFNFSDQRFAFSYLGGTYQIVDDNYALIADENKPLEMYAYKQDALCKKNLVNQLLPEQQLLFTKLQAVIQVYNHAVLSNSMADK